MKSPSPRPRQKPVSARRNTRRGVTLLLVVAGLASVFALREMWQGEVGREAVGAHSARGMTSWGIKPGATRILPEGEETETLATDDAGGKGQKLPPADNSSEIDGAPPVPIEATASTVAPMPVWRPLSPEHMPEAPARTRAPESLQDVAALRNRVESLLVADPEALQQVRALLDEPDPEAHARNLQILTDTFGLD